MAGAWHRRDNEYLLCASSFYSMLKEHRTPYVDLNYNDAKCCNSTAISAAYGETISSRPCSRHLLVCMPKLKTHHWAGVTLSMKNLLGSSQMPSMAGPKTSCTGPGSLNILDINSTFPVPQFAIVDDIVGMEGNGHIQGIQNDVVR